MSDLFKQNNKVVLSLSREISKNVLDINNWLYVERDGLYFVHLLAFLCATTGKL